jgi:hypothetical protein
VNEKVIHRFEYECLGKPWDWTVIIMIVIEKTSAGNNSRFVVARVFAADTERKESDGRG